MAYVGSEKDNLDLFMTHRQRLVDYATTILGSAAQSEDVVQEAWIRFSGAADPGALREPLRYLFRIVRNIVVDGHRAQVSRGRYLVAAATPETTLSRPDDRPAPEAEILYRQQLAIVQEALAELPPRTRRAVELHRLEGLKTREVPTQPILSHMTFAPWCSGAWRGLRRGMRIGSITISFGMIRSWRHWRSSWTLNRVERGRAEPGRFHRIAHDPAAIEVLFVDVFLDAHRAPPPARSCWGWTRPAFPRDR